VIWIATMTGTSMISTSITADPNGKYRASTGKTGGRWRPRRFLSSGGAITESLAGPLRNRQNPMVGR
jgi:hypothetical protein